MKFYARREVWTDGVQLYAVDWEDGADIRFPLLIKFERGEPIRKGMITPSPSWDMSGQEAQMLIDALWQAGLRPHDGTGSGAQVEALKYHLEDMRKLVFK